MALSMRQQWTWMWQKSVTLLCRVSLRGLVPGMFAGWDARTVLCVDDILPPPPSSSDTHAYTHRYEPGAFAVVLPNRGEQEALCVGGLVGWLVGLLIGRVLLWWMEVEVDGKGTGATVCCLPTGVLLMSWCVDVSSPQDFDS